MVRGLTEVLAFSRGEPTSLADPINKWILLYVPLDFPPCVIFFHRHADLKEMRRDIVSREQGQGNIVTKVSEAAPDM